MECRELIALALDAKLADAPAPVRDELALHTAGCAACRAELSRIEETWARLGEIPDATPTPEFRRSTLALLEDEMLRMRIHDFRQRRNIPRGLLEAAAVVVAALGGFQIARQLPFPAAAAPRAAAAVSPLRNAGALSNVSYLPADAQGRIGVTFDVTSRRTVVGRPDDPEMATLVAYLVSRGAQTAGDKSRAIEIASSHTSAGSPASPEIVRALTDTLKNDQNPGVRKKAADALAGFRMTPDIRAAFIDALRTDRNPGVRLVAVEALASGAAQAPLDAKTIESLREKAFDPSENGFVRAKAASALKGIDF